MDPMELTIACFTGGMWIVGRKEKIAGEWYLIQPVIFVGGTQGFGVMSLPGVNEKRNDLKFPLVDAIIDYVVDNPQIEDVYVEHTTGIKPLRAPLVTPNGGNIPRGGGGPRLVQ